MKELVIILTNALSKDEIVDKMRNAVATYESNPEDGWKELQFTSSLVLTKDLIEKKGVGGLLDSFEKGEKVGKLIKTEYN